MALKEESVIAVGSALVDLLVRVDQTWPAQQNIIPGGMELSAPERSAALLRTIDAVPQQVAGGSACNTLVGTAHLGVKSKFVGRLGDDAHGELFRSSLAQSGVDLEAIVAAGEPTGTALSVITPDAQRSMFTSLAASAGIVPADLHDNLLRGFGLLHLEGYLGSNGPVFRRVIELARRSATPVSLDLASFQTVAACGDLFEESLSAVEILIANEDEAKAFTGKEPGEALEQMAQKVPIAVVKLGAEGALIARGSERVRVQAIAATAIDTTGAGDLWASGFLAGWLKGLPLGEAGRWGSLCAGEVVQILGAHLSGAVWGRIGESLR